MVRRSDRLRDMANCVWEVGAYSWTESEEIAEAVLTYLEKNHDFMEFDRLELPDSIGAVVEADSATGIKRLVYVTEDSWVDSSTGYFYTLEEMEKLFTNFRVISGGVTEKHEFISPPRTLPPMPPELFRSSNSYQGKE